jgi:hypothetical protein
MKLRFQAREKKNSVQLRTYYHPKADRSRRRLTLILILIFSVGFLFLLRGAYGVFTVRKVVCESERGGCEDADLKLIEGFSGRLIFRSFSLHSPGKTYTVTKKFPHSLHVMVKDIPISYVIYTDEQKQRRVAISSDGVVYTDTSKLESTSASSAAVLIDLTLAANAQSLNTGEMSVYEKLFEFAKKNPIDVMTIKSREEIFLHTKPDLTAIVSSESIERELHSLQLILSSPTIEQRPAVVDLRFDHPVLRYL